MEDQQECSRRRILIAEFDSVQQAARYAAQPDSATSQLTGMLRIGRLVSDTVLLTDNMLLDGEYFMRLGPEGVLRELGASDSRFPLTITGRAKSLAEGLAQRHNNPNFVWSLSNVSGSVEPPESVIRIWNQWIDFADRGLISYEQQQGAFAIPPAAERPAVESQSTESAEAFAELDTVLARSDAFARIDKSFAGADQLAVRQWWNGRYLRAIADIAGADWLSFELAGAAHLSARSSSKPLQLPAALLSWARVATSSTVALAWDAAHTQRQRLWERATWRTLRDLAYVSTRIAETPSRKRTLVDALVKFSVAFAIILLALPGIEASALDNPLTWIIFGGIIVTTIPFDALTALADLVKPDPRATLILHASRSAD